MPSIQYSIPVLSISGRLGDSQMVFYSQNGRAFVRAFKQPANPATGDQAAVRAYLAASARQWALLTSVQRAAWEGYASLHFTGNRGGKLVAPNGAQLYNKIAFYRQALGLALPGAAPATAPPAPLSELADQAAESATDFVFRVEHALSTVTGFKLLARVTPEVPAGRAPLDGDLRYIAGIGAASFVNLPASGSNATFTGARFAIPEGGVYRAELTVISPDGVPSRPLALNFAHQLA